MYVSHSKNRVKVAVQIVTKGYCAHYAGDRATGGWDMGHTSPAGVHRAAGAGGCVRHSCPPPAIVHNCIMRQAKPGAQRSPKGVS